MNHFKVEESSESEMNKDKACPEDFDKFHIFQHLNEVL